jgi:hypothetical protein
MQNRNNLFGFPFLKLGPVQTGRGPLRGGAGWESEAHRGFNGTRYLGMGPANRNWDPQLITVIYASAIHSWPL